MPAITGGASDDLREFIEEEYVENGPYEDVSEFVNYALRRTVWQEKGERFDY